MSIENIAEPILPEPSQIRAHILRSLNCYWIADTSPIAALPVTRLDYLPAIVLPLRMVTVQLPEWAVDCGIDGELLVPRESVAGGGSQITSEWQAVDWFLAAFLLLEGWHERHWEFRHGPIHSYSFRLTGWDERAWQHAWVNRIGLFLRRWAIYRAGFETESCLGVLPEPDIQMTHDVDAVEKTVPIRLKQSVFNLFNAARAMGQAELGQAGRRLQQAARFLFGREKWWTFDRLLEMEQKAGIRATFHFHAAPRHKSLRRWLFDPGYDIRAPRQRALLREIRRAGHRIGLHPGFESWQQASVIAAERDLLQEAAGISVTHCRQHWLRFSWSDTWAAQSEAGIEQDTTLMLNDRSGFRNSSALLWKPWNHEENRAHRLSALPTVLMDSHCYDYQPMTAQERRETIEGWIRECKSVCGQAALLWHPHTLTRDYGWTDGFEEVLEIIKETKL
jgi:hypothetical protein